MVKHKVGKSLHSPENIQHIDGTPATESLYHPIHPSSPPYSSAFHPPGSYSTLRGQYTFIIHHFSLNRTNSNTILALHSLPNDCILFLKILIFVIEKMALKFNSYIRSKLSRPKPQDQRD